MKAKNISNTMIYILLFAILSLSIFQILDYRLDSRGLLPFFNEIIVILFCFLGLYHICAKVILPSKIINILIIVGLNIVYFLFLNIIGMYRNASLFMVIISIKNFLLPLIILLIGMIDYRYFELISLKKIISIINITSLINIFFVLIEYTLGWKVITNLVLGESVYALPIYSFGHSAGIMRVPGIFCDSLTQGSFSLLVFILNSLLLGNKCIFKKNISSLFCIIGLIGAILSMNRQIVLAICVYTIINLIIKYKTKLIALIFLLSPFIFGVLYYILGINSGYFSLESLFIRAEIWNRVFHSMNLKYFPLNFFIGKGIDATLLGEAGGQLTLVDNSFLLIFHDYGLIGLVLFVILLIVVLKYFYNHYDYNVMAKVSFYYIICFIVRMNFHSSVVNEYDSYMFIFIILLGVIFTANSDDKGIDFFEKRSL